MKYKAIFITFLGGLLLVLFQNCYVAEDLTVGSSQDGSSTGNPFVINFKNVHPRVEVEMCFNLVTSESPQVIKSNFAEHSEIEEFYEYLPEWMYNLLSEKWNSDDPLFYKQIQNTHYFYTDAFVLGNKEFSLLLGLQSASETFTVNHKNPLFMGPELPPGHFSNFKILSTTDYLNTVGSCIKTDETHRYNLKVKNKYGEFKYYGPYHMEELANPEEQENFNFVSYDLSLFTRLAKKVKSDLELCNLIVIKLGKDLNRKKEREKAKLQKAHVACKDYLLPQMYGIKD